MKPNSRLPAAKYRCRDPQPPCDTAGGKAGRNTEADAAGKCCGETSGKRVSELESQLRRSAAAGRGQQQRCGKNSRRVSELEQKLSETQQRMQSASEDAESHSRRIHELEQQLVEADARHTNDLEQAERVGQELIALREKDRGQRKDPAACR